MNVSLTPELEEMVAEKVRSGMYCSASEVVRDALRLLREQDIVRAHRLEELRREVQLGMDAMARGECEDFETAEQIRESVLKASREGRTA